MGRRNNRGGRAQARRRPDGTAVKTKRTPPVPIEHMIVPKGRCFFRSRYGKLRFTGAEVEKALRQAQVGRDRKGATHREERYYHCDQPGGCGDFHLTSRTTYTERGSS